jgi:hypothetical protein
VSISVTLTSLSEDTFTSISADVCTVIAGAVDNVIADAKSIDNIFFFLISFSFHTRGAGQQAADWHQPPNLHTQNSVLGQLAF